MARPDRDKGEEGAFVPVATVWSEPMAQSWVQMLNNNGVAAMVKTGGPGFSFGGPPPFGFESYILVPEGKVDEARSVLEGFEAPGVLELSEPD